MNAHDSAAATLLEENTPLSSAQFTTTKKDVKEEEEEIKEEAKGREVTAAHQPDTLTSAATVVASHYNAIPEVGIQLRNDSRILHLRNLNNWMKSMLIGDFIERLNRENCSRARVLDLACGKGGDLRKWRIGNISEIVMTDIAEISLQDCRDRYQMLRDRRTGRLPFKMHIIQADLTQANLPDLLPNDAPTNFDIASCQFALHYSFRSQQCARRMLRNCTQMIRPGGYFIGTVTNADAIMQFLRRSNGHFSNQVCSVSASDVWFDAAKDGVAPPPLFGAEILFQLEGVVNCPEYLCYFPLLKKLMEELDMELVYEHDFADAISHYLKEKGHEATELMRRMDALEPMDRNKLETKDASEYGPAIKKFGEESESERNSKVGTLSKSEWEVVSMYKVFAFRKRAMGGSGNLADKGNDGEDDEPQMKRRKISNSPQPNQDARRGPEEQKTCQC